MNWKEKACDIAAEIYNRRKPPAPHWGAVSGAPLCDTSCPYHSVRERAAVHNAQPVESPQDLHQVSDRYCALEEGPIVRNLCAPLAAAMATQLSRYTENWTFDDNLQTKKE